MKKIENVAYILIESANIRATRVEYSDESYDWYYGWKDLKDLYAVPNTVNAEQKENLERDYQNI